MPALTGSTVTITGGLITVLRIYVPTVTTLTLAAATVQLNTLGLIVTESYQANTAPIGTVIPNGQSPVAGTQVLQGSTVALIISSGASSPTTGPTARAASLPNLPNKILDPTAPLVDSTGHIQTNWWRLIANISNQAFGTNANQETTITVSGSPFVYTPIVAGSVIVNGGAVSLIEYSPTGKTFYPTGNTGGVFQMVASSSLRVTYGNPPAVTFFPR